MSYGFLCCGPSAERAVYYSSDEDGSSDESEGDAVAAVIRWPDDEGAYVSPDEAARFLSSAQMPAVLPSRARVPKVRRVESTRATLSPRDPSVLGLLAGSWKGIRGSLVSSSPVAHVGHVPSVLGPGLSTYCLIARTHLEPVDPSSISKDVVFLKSYPITINTTIVLLYVPWYHITNERHSREHYSEIPFCTSSQLLLLLLRDSSEPLKARDGCSSSLPVAPHAEP